MARKRVPADPNLDLMRRSNDLQSAFEAMMPRSWRIGLSAEIRMEDDGSYCVNLAAWRKGIPCLIGVSVDAIVISACEAVLSTRLGQVRIHNPFKDEWITIWPQQEQPVAGAYDTDLPKGYGRRLDAESR